MKWMEMIRVRSSSGSLEKGMPEVVQQTQEIGRTSGVADAMVLQHALYDGDLAVVLVWDTDRGPAQTREGLVLAERLQHYGMVDHAVWKAAPGFEHCAEQSNKAIS